jgi:hypothetical protein
MRLLVPALFLLGCSGEPEAPPIADEIATAEGTSLAVAKAPPVPEVSTEPAISPIGVEVRTHGIGPLHRSFLADPDGLQLLGQGLAGLVPSPAQVFVSYNDEERFGLIALRVPPESALVPKADAGWSIARIPSAFAALDAYRRHLGGNFDLRLSSFRVSVQFVRGFGTCSLLPEDDRNPVAVSSCVQVGTESVCGKTEQETLAVEASVSSKLSSCFR